MSVMFTVVGIALTSTLIEQVLAYFGHADKIALVKVATFVACGYVTWDFWWGGVHYVASQFGVFGV